MRGQPVEATHPSGCRPAPDRPAAYWAVVATYRQAEHRARHNLELRGFPTYLPLTVNNRPLFPGYLFVTLHPDTPWWQAKYVPGVFNLIADAAGQPIPLRAGVLEAVQAVEAEAATQQRADAQMAPGVAVAVARGPFAGAQAVVLSVGRLVRIAMVVFGELRELAIQPAFLRLRRLS